MSNAACYDLPACLHLMGLSVSACYSLGMLACLLIARCFLCWIMPSIVAETQEQAGGASNYI